MYGVTLLKFVWTVDSHFLFLKVIEKNRYESTTHVYRVMQWPDFLFLQYWLFPSDLEIQNRNVKKAECKQIYQNYHRWAVTSEERFC